MAITRGRKRPASPETNAQPDPPKRTRKTKKATAGADAADEDETAIVSKPVAKGKSNDSETQKKSSVTTTRKTAAKGKGKKQPDPEPTPEPESQDGQGDQNIKKDEDAQEDEADQKSQPAKVEKLSDLKAEERSTQFAKAEHLIIPVDEHYPRTGYHVYVDSSTRVIYDASLNQTNTSANNNKSYRIQLLTNGNGDFNTWTRWGRVGEGGQSALLGDGSFEAALTQFEKKFKDKSGLRWADRENPPKSGKYSFVERSYEPDSESEDVKKEEKTDTTEPNIPPPSQLPPAVQSLISFIFNQDHFNSTMADMNYDAAKLPLGKLSKTTILRGYQVLKDLAALLDDQSLASSEYDKSYPQAVEQLSNQFYSYIPHDFGRNRPPIIGSTEHLKKEVQLLESLTDLKDADSILKADKGGSKANIIDSRYKGLGMREMTPIDHKSKEFLIVQEYLEKTRGQTHGVTYEVMDIFRIEREGENDRFKSLTETKSDRKLLWHGSRSTNFGGILSQGLRIAPPEAPVSGYMFGKGVYLADMSSKSANYCYSYISNNQALLLLCEAELGAPIQELTSASYSAGDDALAKGLLSTWGKGMTGPKSWKDAECIHSSLKGVKMPDTTDIPGNTDVPGAYLQYHEYICYDVSQIRLRYLLRVKT